MLLFSYIWDQTKTRTRFLPCKKHVSMNSGSSVLENGTELYLEETERSVMRFLSAAGMCLCIWLLLHDCLRDLFSY